jgi:hypothetical protein
LKKNPSQKKRAGRVAQGVDPEFKPQYCKTNKQTKRKARCWCIILATGSGGIEVQRQPRQIVPETLSQKYPTQNRATEWFKW